MKRKDQGNTRKAKERAGEYKAQKGKSRGIHTGRSDGVGQSEAEVREKSGIKGVQDVVHDFVLALGLMADVVANARASQLVVAGLVGRDGLAGSAASGTREGETLDLGPDVVAGEMVARVVGGGPRVVGQ